MCQTVGSIHQGAMEQLFRVSAGQILIDRGTSCQTICISLTTSLPLLKINQSAFTALNPVQACELLGQCGILFTAADAYLMEEVFYVN